MILRIFHSAIFIAALLLCNQTAHAQFEKITIDLQKEKPEKFKNRKLRSERSGEKKLSLTGRFVQNTTSHYNYYFNANSKIESVIENARIANRDDYTFLLPYYSYTLDNTAAQKADLDSVIEKSTAGILLHDLRSDWVDNFYLLIGQSYYLQKKFDSAYMAFQFINYNLAPRDKKSEASSQLVGSNTNQSGALNISSREDRNLLQRTLSKPPSRNDALVWQIRTLTEMGLFAEAQGLINTLQHDPNFPDRLHDYLNEVRGYWFFQQERFDSAIQYIELALPNALDMQDRARREYLLAQLYENKNSKDTAYAYYSRSIRHTTDPLLDIYANLNRAKLLYTDDVQEIKNSIGLLLRMARKDKYQDYRHIVFYAAAELAREIPDTISVVNFLKRSAHFNQTDQRLKNKAFLQLADLSYQLADYRNSYNYYDSLQPDDPPTYDIEEIENTKSALAKIVRQLKIIEREDSLQSIAAMPTNDREALLKKISRRLKKEKGIPDEEFAGGASTVRGLKNQQAGADLFSQNTRVKGDWYFYNPGTKSKGYSEFRREWGERQNIDNWRRITAQPGSGLRDRMQAQLADMALDPMAVPEGPQRAEALDEEPEQTDLSVEGLRANLPLTEILLDSSNQRVALALFELGQHYQTLLEDYSSAISAYETSLQRFPERLYEGALYKNLSYCYKQLGMDELAAKYQNLLLNNFSKSVYAQQVLHPEKFDPRVQDSIGTGRYNDIYNQFIEGAFEEALLSKRAADSTYGQTHWTPQLLYIESVYYIKQRNDSAAITTLNSILQLYPESPMNDKVTNLIRVLNNRDSIENYLTQLEVVRIPEDSQIVVFDDTRIYGNVAQQRVRNDSTLLPKKITTVEIPELAEEKKLPSPSRNRNFVFDAFSEQNVVMVLTKVDPVYVSEARNAFSRYTRSKFYSQQIEVTRDTLDSDRSVLVFSSFVSAEDAMKFLERISRDARSEASWLPADKYAFYIISDDNLELIKENKKLESYLELLRQNLPGKF